MAQQERVAYGYRYDEIKCLGKVVSFSGVAVHPKFSRDPTRRPVAVSLGIHFEGCLLPHGDPSDALSLAEAVKGRMGKRLPIVPNRTKFISELKTFVRGWLIRNNIPRLCYIHSTDFEEWLAATGYPEWRKVEFRKHKDKIQDMLIRNEHGKLIYFVIKLFMKDEFYVDWKQVRGIYARDDCAKIVFGPWFKAVEQVIYTLPEFIKHVPVKDRANYIYDKLYVDGSKYLVTDYSSYEAHFSADIMDACEFQLYEHVLGGVAGSPEVLSIMREVLTGNNKIVNKYVAASCQARRMSGEMNTSLGNGFSNLMFMSFVCHKLGIDKVNGVVEGDDGLFQFSGRAPTTEDFTACGFLIKLEQHDSISTASFCGNLFDEEDKQIITDIRDIVCTLGWTNSKYLNSNLRKKKTLLRCKALSYAHQYPGCPIIGELCQYALRMTRGRTKKDMENFINNSRDINDYERKQYLDAIKEYSRDEALYHEPKINTRLLVEKLYGVSLDVQRSFEAKLRTKNDFTPIKYDLFTELCPKSWRDYYDNYVLPRPNTHLSYELFNISNL